MIFSPKSLLTSDKMDIVVKYMYLCDKEKYGELYKRHILLRTGGEEPKHKYSFSDKKTVKDYIKSFDELYRSFKNHGFKSDEKIPVTEDLKLVNGSHRMACALKLGIDVEVKKHTKLKNPPSWDFNWFKNNGFSHDELRDILYYYTGLKECGIVILFPNSKKYWDSIEKSLMVDFNIVGSLDFNYIDRFHLNETILDMYQNMKHETKKTKSMSKVKDLGFRLIVVDGDNVCERLSVIKKQIRQDHSRVIPVDEFVTLHTSDDKEEFKHMRKVLLTDNTCITTRVSKSYKAIDFVKHLKKIAEEKNILLSDICVVGSCVLDSLGLREARDIDIIIKNNTDKYTLSDKIDVTTGYTSDDNLIISDDKYHYMYRGVKFIKPEYVLAKKLKSKKEKDKIDVELLRKVLAR